MKILYLATDGAADSTRASIPLQIAAPGSAGEGQDCAVVLVGDATERVSGGPAERVEGVGISADERAPAAVDIVVTKI